MKGNIFLETDTIFAIAGVGLIVAMLNLILSKSGRDDVALGVTLAGIVAVLIVLVKEISVLMELMRVTFSA